MTRVLRGLFSAALVVAVADPATVHAQAQSPGSRPAQLIDGGRIFSISPTRTYFGTDKVDQGYLSAIDAKTGKLPPLKVVIQIVE